MERGQQSQLDVVIKEAMEADVTENEGKEDREVRHPEFVTLFDSSLAPLSRVQGYGKR